MRPGRTGACHGRISGAVVRLVRHPQCPIFAPLSLSSDSLLCPFPFYVVGPCPSLPFSLLLSRFRSPSPPLRSAHHWEGSGGRISDSSAPATLPFVSGVERALERACRPRSVGSTRPCCCRPVGGQPPSYRRCNAPMSGACAVLCEPAESVLDRKAPGLQHRKAHCLRGRSAESIAGYEIFAARVHECHASRHPPPPTRVTQESVAHRKRVFRPERHRAIHLSLRRLAPQKRRSRPLRPAFGSPAPCGRTPPRRHLRSALRADPLGDASASRTIAPHLRVGRASASGLSRDSPLAIKARRRNRVSLVQSAAPDKPAGVYSQRESIVRTVPCNLRANGTLHSWAGARAILGGEL